nr:hypothetical protein [Tanacetum cinerariifolium]
MILTESKDRTMALQPHSSGVKIQDLMLNYQRYIQDESSTTYLRKEIPKFRGHRHSWNSKACFVCKSVNHLIKDCDYYEKKMVQKPVRNHAIRVNHQNSTRMAHPHSKKHDVPTAVLTRSRLVPFNAARSVTTVVPQTNVNHQSPTNHVFNKPQSLIKRPINYRPSPKNSNFHQKVTTVKANQVNVVHGVKGNWVLVDEEKAKAIAFDEINK